MLTMFLLVNCDQAVWSGGLWNVTHVLTACAAVEHARMSYLSHSPCNQPIAATVRVTNRSLRVWLDGCKSDRVIELGTFPWAQRA